MSIYTDNALAELASAEETIQAIRGALSRGHPTDQHAQACIEAVGALMNAHASITSHIDGYRVYWDEESGGVCSIGGEDCNAENRVFPPTLVWNCPEDCTLMQEELFGPILPIMR